MKQLPNDAAARVVYSPAGDLIAVDGAYVFDAATLHSIGSKFRPAQWDDTTFDRGSFGLAFVESAGARMQEGLAALSGYGRIFSEHVRLSGVVPQISIVCGPAAGGASYGPALNDFVIMSSRGAMFLTGPAVVFGGGPVQPDGYLVLPAHPWQLRLLAGDPCQREILSQALRRRLLIDLGDGRREVVPTSSVRTVYDPVADVFCTGTSSVTVILKSPDSVTASPSKSNAWTRPERLMVYAFSVLPVG